MSEERLIELFREYKHEISIFMNGVADFIRLHPKLTDPRFPCVHSSKARLKDEEHLREKIKRKRSNGRVIDENNFFHEITDLGGVRILHLFQDQFSRIDGVIRDRIQAGDWVLGERPKAYTWDPENVEYFSNFDLDVSEKPSSYTSVHYLLRPRKDAKVCCELQVRTLFEEIWGEVDHQINYPSPTQDIACREQLRVLSKVVGAGSRLLDSLGKLAARERMTENGGGGAA